MQTSDIETLIALRLTIYSLLIDINRKIEELQNESTEQFVQIKICRLKDVFFVRKQKISQLCIRHYSYILPIKNLLIKTHPARHKRSLL